MSSDATDTSPWSGVLAVGTGALCFVGALSDAQSHRHVATQIVHAWTGVFELTDGLGHCAVTPAAIIPSGCEHSIRIVDAAVRGAMVFIDPDAAINSPINALAAEDTALNWAAAGQSLGNWAKPATPEPEPAMILRSAMDLLRRPDQPQPAEWHPSVQAAVELLGRLLPGPVSLSAVARAVSLSPSRLGRLFNEQVGHSFPTYVRWVRLRIAIESLQRGASLTEASHAAGFTDSAHANRTCHEMFGLSPSQASRNLDWA